VAAAFLAAVLSVLRISLLVGVELMKGEGSLTKLEQLKKEHGSRFKAAASRHKRNDNCIQIGCRRIIGHLKWTPGGLVLVGGYCKRKTCPRATLDKYLEMLERTRAFRQRNADEESRVFWCNVIEEWKAKFRKERLVVSGSDKIRKAMREVGLDTAGRIWKGHSVVTRKHGWHFEPTGRGRIQYLGKTVADAVATVKALAGVGR
jgi:hypothetical protein